MSRLRRSAAAIGLAAGLILAVSGSASAATPYTAYVANKSSGTVTPINTATNVAGGEITVGKEPWGIAITPDGKTAYVADFGSNSVTPINVATGVAATAIAVGKGPEEIAITPDGKTAYVVNSAWNSVTPITLATGTAGGEIPVGSSPENIAITPDGKTAYVVNNAPNTVTPINTATNTAGTPIAVGSHPTGIAITPDGKTAYVVNNAANTVTPITLATNSAGSAIAVGNKPENVAIAPDGGTAYVANSASNTLTPITVATNTAGTPIPAGTQPLALAVTPDGASAYVSSGSASTVTPIDLATSTAGTAIEVGNKPLQVAVTPDQAPVASFTVAPGVSGTATSFDASASTVAYGSIANYHWNFGDGESADTATPTTTHTYAVAGKYTATLTETDSAGTSTTQVFTGQTMSGDGGASAQTARPLTVNTVPLVTAQPSAATVTAPNEASFSVACSGSPSPTVQWQLSSDKGLTWSEIPGQTSTTLAISPTSLSQSGEEYRAVCANVAGSTASHSVTLTVDPVPQVGTGAAGSDGSTTPSGPPDPSHAATSVSTRVLVSARSVTVTARGDAIIWLTCPSTALGGCRGTVTLRLVEHGAKRARALAARCARGCRPLGTARYEARAGQRVRVRVHIASLRQGLFARHRTVRVKLIATTVVGGQTATSTLTINLKAPPRTA